MYFTQSNKKTGFFLEFLIFLKTKNLYSFTVIFISLNVFFFNGSVKNIVHLKIRYDKNVACFGAPNYWDRNMKTSLTSIVFRIENASEVDTNSYYSKIIA